VMVMEVDFDHAVPWIAPTDADEKLFLNAIESPRNNHPNLFNVVFADGHVQAVTSDTTPAELREMIAVPTKHQAETASAK
jgi:prepilin-type processing-associated H-X9-DG protein